MSKLNWPVALVLASIVLGGSYYAVQTKKQSTTEKEKQLQLELDKLEAEKEAQRGGVSAELDAQKLAEENAPDTTPPSIAGYCLGVGQLKSNEEKVCIRIGEWSGYLDSINSVPIVGEIVGDIKSITVDGKRVSWDENNQIYQRTNLYIYGGLNKYKVVAEDASGNVATGYVETTAQNTSNDYDINISN